VSFEAMRVTELELGDTALGEGLAAEAARGYSRALCLTRIHGEPLGFMSVDLRGEPVAGEELRRAALAHFADALERHLVRDGIDSPDVPAQWPAACMSHAGSAGPEKPVTVVVPTRERPERLLACLETLLAQEQRAASIVVVDNAPSTSCTREVVHSLRQRFPQLRYEREPRRGQAWARNRGLAAAETPIVAFVDDDVLVDRRWLAETAAAFGAAPDVGCVTGMILPAELDTEAQQLLEAYGGFSKGFDRRIFGVDRPDRPDDPLFPYTTGTIGSGASMAFDTELLRAIGGFDTALASGPAPCGGEELSAFLRLLKQGRSIVYEPSAIVWHFHPRERRQLLRQVRGYGIGLGAYLTACVVDDPRTLFDFARRSRPALRHFLSASSARNENRGRDYPRSLVAAEALGVLVGPFAYVRGRSAARVLSRSAAAPAR
jgi:GT2 family glycosyltransferase